MYVQTLVIIDQSKPCIQNNIFANNRNLHKFAPTNRNFEKNRLFRQASSYNVHQFPSNSGRSVQTVHTNIFANNRKLHKFATSNSNFEKNRSFGHASSYNVYLHACITISSNLRLVDQSKPCTQIYLQIIASCINLQLPIAINFEKIDFLDMHHNITYINFQQTQVSRSVQTVHTNIFANNRKLHKFTTTDSNFF